jgi:hypothetical protein
MSTLPIDLHLELSSLRNFVNDQINAGNPYALDGKDFYEVLKRVVIDAEVKPFLTPPKNESDKNYYEKYQRLSREGFYKLIPDFFEHEGEFYDLDRVQYAHKDFTRDEDFEKIFIIKLLEIKSNGYSIEKFLSFQQFDNFYGQKESMDSFLYQLIEKDGNCHLLQDLCQVLKDWISHQSLELLSLSSVETQIPEVDNSLIEPVDSQEIWVKEIEGLKGKQLKSKWGLEQIKDYFSFLYKEKSENGEPYLTEENFDKIFINGFKIPENDLQPLLKLNCTPKFPLKNITYGIYRFYKEASLSNYDKKEYFMFFASFLEDYSNIKISSAAYSILSKNATKPLSAINKIEWNKYLSNKS